MSRGRERKKIPSRIDQLMTYSPREPTPRRATPFVGYSFPHRGGAVPAVHSAVGDGDLLVVVDTNYTHITFKNFGIIVAFVRRQKQNMS